MSYAPFATAQEVWTSVAEIVRPARRMLPREAVREYLRTEKGAYDPTLGPMLLEPLDLLASRRYIGICYVGPSRTSKTFTLVLGGVTWIVTCSPGDTQITQMSQDAARRMSKTDIDRSIRHSPELASRLSPRPRDDNVFDKTFKSGMSLEMGWPTVSQHSSKTLKYIFGTDYDRPENRDDVDGEGALWDLMIARIRTYMSRGKCVAESSPGGEYIAKAWVPSTPHEAPPASGILSIYNRGTRARWFWQCQGCSEFFQVMPGLGNFRLPPFEELEQEVQRKDLMWLAEQFSFVACPHCGAIHQQDQKPVLNESGQWVHEGETIDGARRITGDRRRTDIASYWQGGSSATYMTWSQLLLRYFQGVQTYVRTSEEGPLKTTTNTDQACPYMPRAVAKRRSADELLKRLEGWIYAAVPAGVRFLVATVDVQLRRFVVHVHGFGVGLEYWLIDRFFITGSRRMEAEDRAAAIDPASYLEDWDVLIDQVVMRQYALASNPETTMHIELVVCDSGGQEGVTERAYDFWRSLRAKDLDSRFQLVKGDQRIDAPRIHRTWPDAKERKDRRAGGRGDVPVWMLNVNVLKDAVVGDLGREQRGPGFVHLPKWVQERDPDYFTELTVESRNDKGRWINEKRERNEAFDLHVYARAACMILRADAIDWSDPPPWAREPGVIAPEKSMTTLADLAKKLNQP